MSDYSGDSVSEAPVDTTPATDPGIGSADSRPEDTSLDVSNAGGDADASGSDEEANPTLGSEALDMSQTESGSIETARDVTPGDQYSLDSAGDTPTVSRAEQPANEPQTLEADDLASDTYWRDNTLSAGERQHDNLDSDDLDERKAGVMKSELSETQPKDAGDEKRQGFQDVNEETKPNKGSSEAQEGKKIDEIQKTPDKIDQYNSTYRERLNHTPRNDGTWSGDRGESKWIPDDEDVKDTLSQYSVDGIEYKDGLPDFTPVTEHTAQLPDDMLQKSDEDHKNECNKQLLDAYRKKSEKFKNISQSDIDLLAEKGVQPMDFTWHHDKEKGMMRLVPTDVHDNAKHIGGRRIWGGGTTSR